jgi:transcriptional regulator with XRE-family HTH domain
MAKPGRVPKPEGEMITVGDDERRRFKELRLKKKLGQDEVARKVGASQGTISNLENGKHTQIKKTVYANLLRLFGTENKSVEIEDGWRRMVTSGATLTADEIAVVNATIDALNKLKKT